MSSTYLLDGIVRQTTVLLGTLATAAGYRKPLAHVANQVFLELVKELRQQGLGNKVIADMFGLSLRTYHHRVARMSRSTTLPGRSLWEAVLEHLRASRSLSRGEILTHFHRDDGVLVRGVLNDLSESGLVYRTGSGDDTSYRALSSEDLGGPESQPLDLLEHFLLLAINDAGLVTRSELCEAVPTAVDQLDLLLKRLVDSGRVQVVSAQDAKDAVRYRCDDYTIDFHEPAGWEAAVLDHHQAMVSAVCTKVRLGSTQAAPDDAIGGSTFVFDLWLGHPHEAEVRGLLSELRGRLSNLRAKVEDYNGAHPAPRGEGMRIIHYLGQTVTRDHSDG